MGSGFGIGKLRRVPLREVWRHEAHDFTTWLEVNTDVLSDASGISIDSVEREIEPGDAGLRQSVRAQQRVDEVWTLLQVQLRDAIFDLLQVHSRRTLLGGPAVTGWADRKPLPSSTEAIVIPRAPPRRLDTLQWDGWIGSDQ